MKDIQIKDKTDFENPEPGVYDGFSNIEYFKINAISRSTLLTWKKEPMHLMKPNDWTPSKLFGFQMHAYLLESRNFKDNFAIFEGEKRSKEQKAYYQELVEKCGGEQFIIRDTGRYPLQMLKDMKAAFDLPVNQIYKQLVSDKNNPSELTMIWRDDVTGLMCKSRTDKFHLKRRWIVDYKTADDISLDQMRYVIERKYRYDLQAAHYMNGAKALGLDPQGFVIVAQEKSEPYIIKSFLISSNIIGNASYELSELMVGYANWLNQDVAVNEIVTLDYEEREALLYG